MPTRQLYGLLATLGLATQLVNGQLTPDCNPQTTDNCPAKKGWPSDSYYIDFTKETALPANWVMANYEVVNFTSKGAEFSFVHKGDAPNIWTDFYILGGRYDVEMQLAPGVGIITSSVLWSDVLDEVDWEFSGNGFGQTPFPPPDGMQNLQTNIFGQGSSWDGAATFEPWAHLPTQEFHTYSVEWDFDFIKWYVDGQLKREVRASQIPSWAKMPQSPMKLQLGLWDGGDPDNSYWTQQWAGGITDINGGPYTAYVKSVKITNKYPACQFKYNDKSGTRSSIQIITDGCDPAASTPTDANKPGVSTGPATIVKNQLSSSELVTASTAAAYAATTSPVSSAGTTSVSSMEMSMATSTAVSDTKTAAGTYAASSPAISSASSSAESPASTTIIDTATSTGGILSSLSSLILGTSSSSIGVSITEASSISGTLLTTTGSAVTGLNTGAVSSLSSGLYSVATPSSGSHSSLGTESSSMSLSSGTSDSSLGSSQTSVGTGTTPASMSSGSIGSTSGVNNTTAALTTSTIYSTNIYTITSCPPEVKNCPAKLGALTTELISIGTTVCPFEPKGRTHTTSTVVSPTVSTPITSITGPTSVLSTTIYSVSTSISSAPSSFGSSVTSMTNMSSSTSSDITPTTQVQSMPTTYSISSEITTSTISTVFSTNIYTITSCAADVTNCPAKGQVTTEVVSLYTTVCPVTHTVLDGVTVTKANAVQSVPSTEVMSTSYGVTTIVATSAPEITTLVSSLSSSVASSNMTTAASNQTSLSYPASSLSLPVPTTAVLANSSTAPFANTSTSTPNFTTSTVYTSSVYTVTSCGPEVTNCPAKIGQVTTEVVALYTTVCPVKETATSLPRPSSSPVLATTLTAEAPLPTSSPVLATTLTAEATLPTSSSIGAVSKTLPAQTNSSIIQLPSYTTSTVYSTNVYTITSCGPEVKNCPASLGAVTTEVIAISTTVCPVKETEVIPPVLGGQIYSTQEVTLTKPMGSSTMVMTTIISYIDTPGPTSPITPATTSAAAKVTSGPDQRPTTSSCTTLTLGNYFTTVIEYSAITSAAPTSDVPSYNYHATSEIVAMTTTPVLVNSSPQSRTKLSTLIVAPVSSSTGKTAAAAAASQTTEVVTRLTNTVTNMQTVYQTVARVSSSSPSAPYCEPQIQYVTVTAAPVTVTATVQPPYPTSLAGSGSRGFVGGTGVLGTGSMTTSAIATGSPITSAMGPDAVSTGTGTGTDGTGTGMMSTMPMYTAGAAYRRWFRRGEHGYMHRRHH